MIAVRKSLNPRIAVLVVLLIGLGVVLQPGDTPKSSPNSPAAKGKSVAARGVEEGVSGGEGRITWASWREGPATSAPDEGRPTLGKTVEEEPTDARSKVERDLAGVDVAVGGRRSPPGRVSGDERRRAGN